MSHNQDFFTLFASLGANPRYAHAGGRETIQVIGLCHQGENHSALFNPDSLTVYCFSECGCLMRLSQWLSRAMKTTQSEAEDFLENWANGNKIDLNAIEVESREVPYERTPVRIVEGMPQRALAEIHGKYDFSLATLARTVWHTVDGIDPQTLRLFGVGVKDSDTILLPHHNIRGEEVGYYERSFKPLRKIVEEKYRPDKAVLGKFPRAKYVPMLRTSEWADEQKTSWSFPNSRNLYGLHLAAEHIQRTKQAIVFEGGKSVMLSRQYGYAHAVATHTFGIHLNHITMLIFAGAETIVLAFDKQYRRESGHEWALFLKKTQGVAEKVKDSVKIKIIIDERGLLDFKDSPIDKGKEVFEILLNDALAESPPTAATTADYERAAMLVNPFGGF